MRERSRHDVTVPFLVVDTSSPPATPWRTKARDLQRRPALLKRVAAIAILLAFAVPVWMLTHASHEQQALVPQERPAAPSPAAHDPWPPSPHHHAGKPQASSVDVPAVHDDSGLAEESAGPAEDRVVFSLLIWSEGSASEGVVLIKVRPPCSVLGCWLTTRSRS